MIRMSKLFVALSFNKIVLSVYFIIIYYICMYFIIIYYISMYFIIIYYICHISFSLSPSFNISRENYLSILREFSQD